MRSMSSSATRRRPLRACALAAALAAVVTVLQASPLFLSATPSSSNTRARALDVGAATASGAVSEGLERRGLAIGGLVGIAGYAPAAHGQEDEMIATFHVDLEGDDNGKGEIKVKLHPDWAPRGVRRFQELVRIGEFEESAVFHVDGGKAHFGLPANPILEPARIKDDLVRASNKRGTLTFTQGGFPNSRVNEMFFNCADNTRLDKHGFAPIGEVIEGMDLVDRLYSGYGSRPKKDIVKSQGNSYLDEEFPKLSKIKRVDVSM